MSCCNKRRLTKTNKTMEQNNKPISRRIVVYISSILFSPNKNMICLSYAILGLLSFYLSSRIISYESSNFNNNDKTVIMPLSNNKESIKKNSNVQLPILVVGLPKTGTTSIFHYFDCGKFQTSHYRCANGKPCSNIIQSNIQSGRPPLANTRANKDDKDSYDVYTQMDGNCYFPQIESLEEIHEAYPDATLILNVRNASSWVKSVRNQKGCHASPKCVKECMKVYTDAQLILNYTKHVTRIRHFVRKYPSHRLVEIHLEDEYSSVIMEEAFGIDAKKCWTKANVNNRIGS